VQAEFEATGEEEVSRADFEELSPTIVDWSASGLGLGHLVGKRIVVSSLASQHHVLFVARMLTECVV
jgi:hypothetical protein